MAYEPLPRIETPSLTNQPFAPGVPSCDATDGESWVTIINRVLAQWRLRPELLDDVGIDPPTEAAIAAASEAACRLRDQAAPIPSNVSPTGDGGIAMHYEHNGVLLTIEFDSAGHRELLFHFGGQLVRLGEPAAT